MEDTVQELKNYQLFYMILPSMTEEDCARAREELVKTLQEQGAHVVQSAEASKTKLAYPIAKQTFAFVGKIIFLAQPNTIPSLNTTLRQEEQLLRFALLKKEEKGSSSGRRSADHVTRRRGIPRESAGGLESFAVATPGREGGSRAAQKPQDKAEMPRKDQEKITIEDIDRKLDEIMKNIH